MPEIPYHPRKIPKYDMPITGDNIKSVFQGAADLTDRQVFAAGEKNLPCRLFFIDGLTSGGDISNYILKPLMACKPDKRKPEALFDELEKSLIYAASGSVKQTMDEVCMALTNGFAVLVLEGCEKALAFEVKTPEKRSISGPSIENTVKGTQDAFVETGRTNTALIRRHLKTADLCIKEQIVGRQTKTTVSVLYIKNLTNTDMVNETIKRIGKMDIDGLLYSNTLEEYLFDKRSIFPRLIYTERTDRFCTELMGGRVGIIVDGMPLGFLLPATLSQIMKTPEDRTQNNVVSSCLRVLRYLALMVTLLLPGIYLAVQEYHREILPKVMLESILKSKESVAAGTAMEVLLLLIAFELLQEAGLRLPKNTGQTLGVIGGLVVGTAAVDAKLITPIVLVVVSVAGIAGYTIPNQDFANSARLWRLVIVIASWVLGLYGILLACFLLLLSLAKLESFAVPYLTPFITGNLQRIVGDLTVQNMKSDYLREEELQPENKRSKA